MHAHMCVHMCGDKRSFWDVVPHMIYFVFETRSIIGLELVD